MTGKRRWHCLLSDASRRSGGSCHETRIDQGSNVYPSYKEITAAKKECWPEGIPSDNANSATRAFSEEETFAEVTGVSDDLVRCLHIILHVVACGHQIDPDNFQYFFCDATADLIVHLYGWYHMPVSAHKVLMHGSAVMQALTLPLGKLS